jgi:hypothetical protein
MRSSSVTRFLAVAVVASFAVAGPLAPLAHAQQPTPPPTQPAQPAPPAQPDLFQETLKAQRASDKAQGYYEAGAIASNVLFVPGKTVLCVLGGGASLALMLATFGSGYKAASYIMQEGCGGKWVLTGDDLRPDRPSTVIPEEQR